MPLYNVVLIWIALGVVTLTVDRLYIRSLRPAKARQRAPGVPVSDHAWEELCVSHAAIVATLPDSIRADFEPPVTVVSKGKIVYATGGVILKEPWEYWTTPWIPMEAHRQRFDQAVQAVRDRCPDCIHPGCTGCLGRG
jgi:hypothetical protein